MQLVYTTKETLRLIVPVRLPVRPGNITSDIIFDYKIIMLSYTEVNASWPITPNKLSGLVPVHDARENHL